MPDPGKAGQEDVKIRVQVNLIHFAKLCVGADLDIDILRYVMPGQAAFIILPFSYFILFYFILLPRLLPSSGCLRS